jgi:hypothetical protein
MGLGGVGVGVGWGGVLSLDVERSRSKARGRVLVRIGRAPGPRKTPRKTDVAQGRIPDRTMQAVAQRRRLTIEDLRRSTCSPGRGTRTGPTQVSTPRTSKYF